MPKTIFKNDRYKKQEELFTTFANLLSKCNSLICFNNFFIRIYLDRISNPKVPVATQKILLVQEDIYWV